MISAEKGHPDIPIPRHLQYLDRARARPFIKWAGGKRSLIPQITKLVPPSFGDYWEPFVGGGAVFFALDSRIAKAHLSDVNHDLMRTYQMLRKQPGAVIDALKDHERKHDKTHYYRVRDKWHDEQDAVALAARFIYLNKTCFNGLYRVNKQGRFNVPIGRHGRVTVCDEPNLLAVSEVLKKADMKIGSFENIEPKRGDLVYCDPPYDGTFTGYTGEGFKEADQRLLRDKCEAWRRLGVNVIASNSDTELTRSLYHRFDLHEVHAPRNINSNGNGRGPVRELLIVGAS